MTKYIFLVFLVFVHGSWLTAPQTLGISWLIRAMWSPFIKYLVSCVHVLKLLQSHKSEMGVLLFITSLSIKTGILLKNWLFLSSYTCLPCIGRWILYYCTTWEAPKDGAGCQKKQPYTEDWNFPTHPWYPERGKGLEVESITNGQLLIKHVM